MATTSFELNVSLPTDGRFAETARDLAAHAARHAGSSDADARAFGIRVEGAVRARLEEVPSGASLPFVVRRASGPVEVLIGGRTIALDP